MLAISYLSIYDHALLLWSLHSCMQSGMVVYDCMQSGMVVYDCMQFGAITYVLFNTGSS